MAISKKSASRKPIAKTMKDRTVQIMIAPKSAFTPTEVDKVKADFLAVGIDLVVVIFSDSAISSPQFHRMIETK